MVRDDMTPLSHLMKMVKENCEEKNSSHLWDFLSYVFFERYKSSWANQFPVQTNNRVFAALKS